MEIITNDSDTYPNEIDIGDDVIDRIRRERDDKGYILRGFFDPDILDNIREYCHEYSLAESPTGNIDYYEGVENHYKILDRGYEGGRPEFRRLFQHFMWNEAGTPEIESIGKSLVHARNRIAELDMNMALDTDTGYYTSYSAVHYPSGKGFLGPHGDHEDQMFEVILLLTEYGEDYEKGGLYFFDDDGEHHFVDPQTEKGDLVLAPASNFHGTYRIDPDTDVDLTSQDGRWMMFTPMVPTDVLASPPE
jgi:hypothetical protein